MNAISLLKQDHKLVQDLFNKYERASSDDLDLKKDIVDKIIRELSVHSVIEEQVFYPMVRQEVEGANDEVLESLEEHHVVKWLLSEIDNLKPSDERYDAKVHVLIESVKRHIEEEEGDMFPKVSSKIGRGKLEEIGKQLESAKATAPDKPQPRAPDSPPLNDVMTSTSAMMQKGASRVKGAGQKVVSALNRRAGRSSSKSSGASTRNTSKSSGISRKSAKKPSGGRKAATRKGK